MRNAMLANVKLSSSSKTQALHYYQQLTINRQFMYLDQLRIRPRLNNLKEAPTVVAFVCVSVVTKLNLQKLSVLPFKEFLKNNLASHLLGLDKLHL